MPEIYVVNHVTLDGVVQGPGRADEDTRDGFRAGGWSVRGADDVVNGAVHARVAEAGGLRLLLGRRSYEDMLGYWNTQDSPLRDGLNAAPKYVASRTLGEPAWPNTTVLTGEVAEEVAGLKDRPGPDLCVMGSGGLLQSLLAHGLVDEFLLLVHPLVLGGGHRLFPSDGVRVGLRLRESATAPSGVVIARYRVDHDSEGG